jgi:uncharacterized protein (TIGR02996 family)
VVEVLVMRYVGVTMPNPSFTAEDKAFLRAILENPQDATARLVYADWLDDHSDPRGTYLRVEMDLQAQTDPQCDRAVALCEWLANLKRDIDPFWLACFDRPPIEGCEQRFSFLCPRKWEQLQTTDVAEIRYCTGCQQNVYYCNTIQEAQEHARCGECVAISLTVLRKPEDVTFGGMDLFGEFEEMGELDIEDDDRDDDPDDIE